MDYNTAVTDTLLEIIADRELIDPGKTAEIVADYYNGYVVQRILQVMEESGVNQNELAKRIERSRQYVSKILNEKRNFTIQTLALFSCALDCELLIEVTKNQQPV